MNIAITKNLEKNSNESDYPKILPHQLGSVDFMLKQILGGKNILMFHEMGSGKTIVSLILASILTKYNKKINVVLPNMNIKELWISKLNIIKQLLPYNTYLFNNIFFETKKDLIQQIYNNRNKAEKLRSIFVNTVFILDEAHNLFGNTGSEQLILLQELFYNEEQRPQFILVTGSPLTNTLLTLKDLFSILSYQPVNESAFITQNGNKIFDYTLTKEGELKIKNDLQGCVSFFTHKANNIPSKVYNGSPVIKIPIIPCIMSKEQTANYNLVKKDVVNEMFFKYLLDVSFTAMGSFSNIQNFETLIKSGEKHYLTDTLYVNKGRFYGDELTTLNNSAKLKYFVQEKIHSNKPRTKTFIYFSNARIGGQFIQDAMRAQGVQEYGAKQLSNFICFTCGKKRSCSNCKPLTFIIITSIHLTSVVRNDETQGNQINNLIDIYNSPLNDEGEEIAFIFGSKIISESYTLKETRDIWFLTIPDSQSEMSQIVARCLRSFSYKDITKPVTINVPVSFQNNFDTKNLFSKKTLSTISRLSNNQEKINNFISHLIDKDNNYPYDLKKVLYLEIKSRQTKHMHDLLKDLSPLTSDEPHEEVCIIFILEILRRMFYSFTTVTLDQVEKCASLVEKETVREQVKRIVKDGVIVYNKRFFQCFVKEDNSVFYIQPIRIKTSPFLYMLDL